MTGQPIVFLDTETTSLLPDRRVWEVAMIRRDDQGERERRFFLRNVDLSTADAYSLKVGGFYDRHPQYCPAEDRPTKDVLDRLLLERYPAAQEVEKWTRGATIVGSVPSFDADVLAKTLRSCSLTPAWHYHLIDIKALAAGWLVARGVDLGPLPWNSDRLAELCGVEAPSGDDRHTALGDARWVRSWWDTITGPGSLEQIVTATTDAVEAARAAHPANRPVATVTPLTLAKGTGR